MKKKLERLEIYPGKNGGHRIVHGFQRQPVKQGGAMSGGIYNERPPEEEHNFGPGEQQQHGIMSHIARALGFSKVAQAEGKENQEMVENA